MTTPTYSINGGTTIHGVTALWDDVPIRRNDTGTIDYSSWKRHTWRCPIMGMTQFLELAAAQGEALTSLETNDVDDRNEAATYTSVILGVVNGQHVGLNVHNVMIEFRVKT